MQISSLYDSNPVQWNSRLSGLLEFLREYGEQRITLRGCRELARLTPEQLALPGVSLLVATVRGQNGRQLAGVSFVSGYGKEACVVAVHPLYRKGIPAQPCLPRSWNVLDSWNAMWPAITRPA